jgi:6-phosphogluconate dehydrogenase
MGELADVGVVGLGVMGGNLARNFASHGFKVAGQNRDQDVAQRLLKQHPEAQLRLANDLRELVSMLARPRRIILLVNAGAPVDAVLQALGPLLDSGDVVVDGGNSHFVDTDRRLGALGGASWTFVGMGISGGSEGALRGPAMMPGGTREAWATLQPLLEKVAARSPLGACVGYCGSGSAGHYVKMAHNGIEYGLMQLIAEVVHLMRAGMRQSAEMVARELDAWNRAELASFLLEITVDILRTKDPEGSGLLLDAVLDRAGQKGTGKWTVESAADLGVPVPTITTALEARGISAMRDLRVRAEPLFGQRQTLSGVTPQDMRDALYAASLASYLQGFALLAKQSLERGYGTELAEVARIWTGGCIIRSALLPDLRAALSEAAGDVLVLAPSLVKRLKPKLPGLRRVVSEAALVGHAAPALSASLAYFDGLATARGPASLIQAQRDYFGSHTYERIDSPGVAVHSDWAALKSGA